MLLYRVAFKDYSNTLYASGTEGRWNSKGNKVIYTAENPELATLEMLVRRKGYGFDNLYKTMIIYVPDGLNIESINKNELVEDWRDINDYSPCQALGDKWFTGGKSSLLKVPSVFSSLTHNVVINTMHPDYSKIKLIDTVDLIPDKRLEEILKHPPKF